ncbi:MAG: DUF4199 domain-containing protein [Bacteroidales bacterium]|nr:DUF4199 domain-containing protein [Bacteroidales bacterium]
MKKEFTSGESWNSAAIAGLVLALVTIAAECISMLCGKLGGVAGAFLGFLVWAGKMVLCALVFKRLLTKFQKDFADIDYPRLQRYGLKLALFSSLLVTAWSIINLLIINPDTLEVLIDTMRTSYSSMLDSNSMAALDKMLPKMPYYMAIGSFIYYFFWGWLYSTIFSRSSINDDPFADDKETIDNQ